MSMYVCVCAKIFKAFDLSYTSPVISGSIYDFLILKLDMHGNIYLYNSINLSIGMPNCTHKSIG